MIPWDEYRYVLYADRFGWTPDQVDNLPLKFRRWCLPIANAIDEEHHRRHEEAVAKAAKKAKR